MKRNNTDIEHFLNSYPSSSSRFLLNKGEESNDEHFNDSSDDDDLSKIFPRYGKREYGKNDTTNDEDKNETQSVNIMDDFFQNDTIRNKKYPGEEDAEAIPSSIYNKQYKEEHKYMNDKVDRLKIISKDTKYKFTKEIAGALGVSIDDIIESDTLDRAVYDHNEQQLDINRRITDTKQKEKQIGVIESKLKSMKIEYNNSSNNKRLLRSKSDIERLKNITGGYHFKESIYGYFSIAFEYAEYKIILDSIINNNESNNKALMGIMERYYTYYELGSFERRFKDDDRLTEKDDLSHIAVYALWYKDFNKNENDRRSYDANGNISFTESLRVKLEYLEDELIDLTGSKGKKEKENLITNNITTIMGRLDDVDDIIRVKGANQPVKEELIIKEGIRSSNGSSEKVVKQEKITSSYESFMISLFNSEGDSLKISNLIKGVNIATIHNDELNNIISSLGNNINTTNIIDTSKNYFKEQYYKTNDIIDIYDHIMTTTTNTQSQMDERDENFQHIIEDLQLNYGILGETLIEYDKVIHPLISSIIMDYIGNDKNTNIDSILDIDTLREFTGNYISIDKPDQSNNLVYRSAISRDDIMGSVIRNPEFKEYYDKGIIKINDNSDKQMVSLLNNNNNNILEMIRIENNGIIGTRKLTNNLYLCKLFLDLAEYLPSHNVYLQDKIIQTENALDKARNKIQDIMNEDDDTVEQAYGDIIVRQRRRTIASHNNLSKPINSGIIEYIPSIIDKIDEAYNLVIEYCPKLYNGGKPIPKDIIMHSESSFSCGLAGDFARFIAVLSADLHLLFKDSYKSKIDHDKVIIKKAEIMERLKKYSFIKRSNNLYIIQKILPSNGVYQRFIR